MKSAERRDFSAGEQLTQSIGLFFHSAILTTAWSVSAFPRTELGQREASGTAPSQGLGSGTMLACSTLNVACSADE